MFRFTIRDVLWLMAVVAVGLCGVMWVNRFVYTNMRLDRLYEQERLGRKEAEAEVMALQSEIAKLRADLQPSEPNP